MNNEKEKSADASVKASINPSVSSKEVQNLAIKEVDARGTTYIKNQVLSIEAFRLIGGVLAGYPFVKIVIDREAGDVYFLQHSTYPFHAKFIGEVLLKISNKELESKIDHYNQSFYHSDKRRFYLGILSLHESGDKKFFTVETVEVDTMGPEMLLNFYNLLKSKVDALYPLFLKPANHFQEAYLSKVDSSLIPRIYSHELSLKTTFVPLNVAKAIGRLKVFKSMEEYNAQKSELKWHDIIVMPKVPDDIPRVAGIINAEHTTPLSHTNVLASGWQIPNSIQIGVIEKIEKDALSDAWVEYSVDNNQKAIHLIKTEKPLELLKEPLWKATKIKLDEPQVLNVPILPLESLRTEDRYKYGTKAANLGELHSVLTAGSGRLLGFYQIKRPPRKNLLPYLAKELGLSSSADSYKDSQAPEVFEEAQKYLQESVVLPKGIAIPFSIQEQFLSSSPKIQQAIGKLKMALELNARQVDALCISLQKMIVETKLPNNIRSYIDSEIMKHLGGVSSFVVRSSSNAEDLEGFSAAGIYESINHVSSAENIFESIKKVWASVLSPRSVRLRQGVGISLDDVYMGVIIQEEIEAKMGGVLVTTNPASRGDFRNVYMNVSTRSAIEVVQGAELPHQFLYNTVEGGGRTLSYGDSQSELSEELKAMLQRLAYCGRFLQSHFSPDYTFSAPVDIEWLADENKIYILQLRPYSK